MKFKQLKQSIQDRKIEAQLKGVELKSSWQQYHGKDISAIANNETLVKGWLVLGVDNNGAVIGKDVNWLKTVEQEVTNHIRQYLEPSWAVINVFGEEINGGQCLFIEISNPQDVVKWNGKAYHLCGTSSKEMKPHELLELSLKLPGSDFSKAKYSGEINGSQVIEFVQKVTQINDDFQIDLNTTSTNEILRKLNIFETNAAGILFGSIPFRVVHFNEDGDILDQRTRKGLYQILSDSFIEEIQSRARKKATVVEDGNISAAEEAPYPLKALREILANAVAHALYQKSDGDLVVETHPNRITVRNNCTKNAIAFLGKWFSRIHKPMNKHLMNTLRVARITDEQGSGKIRIFRLMLESGKREPIADFHDLGDYGRWSISLFNEESNLELKKISDEIRDSFPDKDQWRIATALLLWRDKKWNEISEYLDDHYKFVAKQVLENKKSPVMKFDNQLYTKRWAKIRLTGQITKSFSEQEKNVLYKFLNKIAFMSSNEGHISSEQAREYSGLSNSPSEMTQLARLFGEWKDEGKMIQRKKGQWQFTKKVDVKQDNL
ncbi:RNA-binding domain-containing protein [bacterium]